MAKITEKPNIDLVFNLTINEEEASFLYQLSMYNFDDVLRSIKTVCGSSYLAKHENGFKSLLETARKDIGPALSKVSEARDIFNGKKRYTEE